MQPTRFSASRWSSEDGPARWVLREAAWSGLDRLIVVTLAVIMTPVAVDALLGGRLPALPALIVLTFVGLALGAKGKAARVEWSVDKRTGAITRNGAPSGWVADVTVVRVVECASGFFPYVTRSYDVFLDGEVRRLVATLGDMGTALDLAGELGRQLAKPLVTEGEHFPHRDPHDRPAAS